MLNSYNRMMQLSLSIDEVKSFHTAQLWVHDQNYAADAWYAKAESIQGTNGRRSMLLIPDTLLGRLASLHREQARKLVNGMTENQRQVTGLGFQLSELPKGNCMVNVVPLRTANLTL
eukprot:6487594-Amphidinium_carterae.6